MRRRTQRILISLLAFLIAGFAMANAYTFEVINWSPFGILNLEKLILKKSPTSTGIILDGKDFSIKIDPENEDPEGGKIRVYEICEESGANCKKVTDLIEGNGANGLITIVSTGREINYCYSIDGEHLYCNGDLSGYPKKNGTESIGGNRAFTGANEPTIRKTKKGLLNPYFKAEDDNQHFATEYQVWTGDMELSGKIAALSGRVPVNEGNDGYICVKNGENTICNKVKLGEMSNSKLCYFNENTKSIECSAEGGNGNPYVLPSATYSVLGGVMLGSDQIQEVLANSPSNTANKTYPIQVDKYGRLVVNVPRVPGNGNGGGVTIVTGTSTQYCYSTDGTTLYCNNTLPSGGDGTTIVGNSGQRCKYICDKTETQGNKVVCVSGHVECNASEPTCQGNCNAGDSILLSGSGGGRCRYGALGTNGAIWNLGNLEGTIKTGIICTEDAPTGGDGLRESSKVTNGSTTSNNALLHPKSISQDLYISGDIYHDGAIKIQTLGASTAYRVNDITIHSQGVSIGEWPNKNGGLGVHGPIAVGKYMTQTTSRPGGGCSAGTERNTISIYASGAAGTDNFEILGSPRILVGVKNGGYLYFDNNNKLGINTTGFNSSSTLTVNGPVKIGNDCNNRGCSEANRGEIRYYEVSNVGHFVGCTKIGNNNYQRRDLSIGNDEQQVSINNNCNGYNTPYNSSIYETTIAQQTICN